LNKPINFFFRQRKTITFFLDNVRHLVHRKSFVYV
jgi:hypothetical protein